LECLLPCIRQKSRSLSPESSRIIKENKALENCKETPQGRACAQYEALMQAERKRACEGETFCRRKRTITSPHREERGFCFDDYMLIEQLGKGEYGQVVLAKKKSTGGHNSSEEAVALKIVPKNLVSEVEREVLVRAVGHPFIVQLHAYFETNESFCYVMENCEGGTLQSLMCRQHRFHEDVVRFYAAEIIVGVNFLHECGIAHGDIKPDNVLLDRDGHCKLADFGLSEVGINKGTGGLCEFDWIGVGFIMSDMMVGNCHGDLHPEQYLLCLTKDAVSVIKMLKNMDRRRRPGAQGDARSIIMHPFFKTVDWEAMLQKRITPPLNPVTMEFLTEDLEAPGDTEESGSDISFKSAIEEAMLVGPQPVKCPILDQGASGKMKKLVMVAVAVVMVAVAVVMVAVSFVLLVNILYDFST